MTAVSLRNELTSNQLLQSVSCTGKVMLDDLGTTYRRGMALGTVRNFQNSWNQILPQVTGVAGVKLPSRNRGMLVVDGLYGAQSAAAVSNFVKGVSVPLRAADIPPWASANQSAVMEMCPPAPPLAPIPPTVTDVQIQAAKQAPPIDVVQQPPQQVLPEPPPPYIPFADPREPAYAPPPIPIPVAVVTPTPPMVKPLEPVVVAPAPPFVPVAAPVIEIPATIASTLTPAGAPVQMSAPAESAVVLPQTIILAPKRRGDAPLVAVGLGLAAVAGVAGWWAFGRRKRR